MMVCIVSRYFYLIKKEISMQYKIKALQSNAYRRSSLITPRALVPTVGRTHHSSLSPQGGEPC